MRLAAAALVVGLGALSAAYPQQQVFDRQLLERQRDVLRLFRFVNQPSHYEEFVRVARSYNVSENAEKYSNFEVVQEYNGISRYGLLPRGEIFSVFYERHLKEAVALYKLLYYANDYETFYRTAIWARQNVNEGVFLYALSVAIVHRPDTYGIVLPPIYEIYPNYFFSTEVIQKAYKYKQKNYGQQKQKQKTQEGSSCSGYINANYTGYYLNLNPEQSLSYFTEDVGINSFYYYYNIHYPFWLGDFNYDNDRRGELFLYIYQQLLARFYLERLSNGFGEISHFSWEVPFETGYYPSLQYSNGLPFPTRPNFAKLNEYFYNYGQRYGNNKYAYSYTRVQDFERRIRDAIDRGYVYTESGDQTISLQSSDGINILGNLIESNPDSPNSEYYGTLQTYARHLLGYSYQPLTQYQIAPSALEQFETSLRDPAFYQLYRRILLFVQQYQSKLKSYTEEDLSFQGVQITNVECDRLITYFDYFYSDLSNAVYVTPEEYRSDNLQIRARQYRLNNKAFTYRISVDSNQEQKASVRVYIGPKYDEYGRYLNISQNRHYYVQFDHFVHDLKSGENIIERNSRQSYFYQNDRTSYKELWGRVLAALDGSGALSVDSSELYFGFPRRFLLPRGSYGGTEYQFYVIVSPYLPYQAKNEQWAQTQQESKLYYPRVGSGGQYLDDYPLGYPFNRPVQYDQIYSNIPNAHVYSAKVYNRDVSDINASNASQQE